MIRVEKILHILIYLAAAIGVLPLLPFLDYWIIATVVLGFLLGLFGDRNRQPLLGDRLATLLAIGFFLLFLLRVSLANLVTPLIDLLCLLLAVRLASDKSARHMLQLFMLATIILASSSMLTLDLAYFFYLILIVLLVSCGLVLLTFYATDAEISFGRRQWGLLLKTMTALPVGSLLLMIGLFVILPRTQTPLWNFLNPKPAAKIGMTDQVQPGSVAELAGSGAIAFRAETEQLPTASLYWRGIVLNQLEGSVWTRNSQVSKEELQKDSSAGVQVSIYAEPNEDSYLVTLDYPVQVTSIRHRTYFDGTVIRSRRDERKVRYQVHAQLDAKSIQVGPVDQYLQLPDNVPARVMAVAADISRNNSYQEKVNALDRFFIAQKLSYATTDLPTTETPIETFLFTTHRGYCEYFASSYAVLLRLAGVPARLVGGYLGGDYNRLGGYYLVGEDTAHVWVEALDDAGIWQRIDPSRLAVNAGTVFAADRFQGVASLRALADAMLHNWTRLVLNYDLHQQFNLVRDLLGRARGLKKLDSRSLQQGYWLLIVLLPPVLWILIRRRQTRGTRLVKRYRLLLAKMAGIAEIPADVGLYELAKLCGHPLCHEFAEIYGSALYRDRPLGSKDFRRLEEILVQLKKSGSVIRVALPSRLGDNIKS